jgi:hypothetical protein
MGLLDKPGPHRLENGYLEPSDCHVDEANEVGASAMTQGFHLPRSDTDLVAYTDELRQGIDGRLCGATV